MSSPVVPLTQARGEGFIRLSAGVEDIGDLAADLTRALDTATVRRSASPPT
jgi:O-acetylhomoserine/O-acetylserine sulfhydrylase-like pyridoxal-dependent enzyme